MQNKEKRILQIRKILTLNEVGSQDELLRMILEEGFVCTQATLSRDLKEMKAFKTVNDKGQYVIKVPPEREAEEEKPGTFANGFDSVSTINFSGNIMVIKTATGYASAVATKIDALRLNCLIGTVAGDDTIISVIREGYTSSDVKNELAQFNKNLSEKIR